MFSEPRSAALLAEHFKAGGFWHLYLDRPPGVTEVAQRPKGECDPLGPQRQRIGGESTRPHESRVKLADVRRRSRQCRFYASSDIALARSALGAKFAPISKGLGRT